MSGQTHSGTRHNEDIVIQVMGRKRGRYAAEVATNMLEQGETMRLVTDVHPFYTFKVIAPTHHCTYCKHYGNSFRGDYASVYVHADIHPVGSQADMTQPID